MTELTPLDQAHAAMEAAPQDDTARLAFYERLADAEFFLMLAEDPREDDQVTPEVFDLADARYVLIFDREERLAAFAGQVTPYVALSGRIIASLLTGQGIGLGVNLDVAPSSILLPPDAVAWLSQTLGNQADEVKAQIVEVSVPTGLPDRFVSALDTKLATAMGLARSAFLVGVTYDSGARGHMLGFVDAIPEAQTALTQATTEALTFSGIDAGAIDVAFFGQDDRIIVKLERHGLRFDLPQMQQTPPAPPNAPGMDPEKPPKLK